MERQDSNGFCFFVQNETIRKKVFKIDLKNLLKMEKFLKWISKTFCWYLLLTLEKSSSGN